MKKKNKSNISKYKKTDLSRCLLFIEPGPVVLVSSYNLETQQPNLMTISWTIALDFNHHIALCTGPWNYSFDLIMKTKECVVAIPPASMAETVVKIGMLAEKMLIHLKDLKSLVLKRCFVHSYQTYTSLLMNI